MDKFIGSRLEAEERLYDLSWSARSLSADRKQHHAPETYKGRGDDKPVVSSGDRQVLVFHSSHRAKKEEHDDECGKYRDCKVEKVHKFSLCAKYGV